MAYYLIQDTTLAGIAEAIRAKTGKTDMIPPLNMPTEIGSIQTGGGGSSAPVSANDITFYDYDGTIVASYSIAEVQALTSLPDGPAHEGLTFQGWNWTLEAIKALNRPVTVGAMYITDDGATRLHIRIATVGRMTVPLYIGQTVANGVSIDWGDESTAETMAGTGNVNTSHTYAEPGDYIISLIPQDGCTLSFGNGTTSYCVMGATGNKSMIYCNMLKEVYIGKNVTSIGANAFSDCPSLSSIVIPTGVTSIGAKAFSRCSSLSSIVIPTGVTSIGSNAFLNCPSLSSIVIPDGVTSIGNSAFSRCSSLSSIVIPTSVTSIGSNAFQNCSSLSSIVIPTGVTSIDSGLFYHCISLSSIVIPTSVTSIGSNAFSDCSSLSSITIPTGVTSIDSGLFDSCYSLASIVIPNGVTSIGSRAFSSCFGMRYYDFSACTAIPALFNTSVFEPIPSDCQMLIPSELYDNWKIATNWATYKNYMVAV